MRISEIHQFISVCAVSGIQYKFYISHNFTVQVIYHFCIYDTNTVTPGYGYKFGMLFI